MLFNNLKLLSRNALPYLMLFGLFSGYYWKMVVVDNVQSDVQLHVGYLADQVCARGFAMPPNCGFHLLVWLVSGFQCNFTVLLKASTFVLGACWASTVALTVYFASDFLGVPRSELGAYRTGGVLLLVAVSTCLVFPVPVAKSTYYIGLLGPNVYHNSTWITALPWVVGVSGLAARQLNSATRPWMRDAIIGVLLLISVLCKPSFAFVFVPAYGLVRAMAAPLREWPRLVLPLVLALGPGLALLWGQTLWLTWHPETTMRGAAQFAFALPAGWRYFMPELTWKHSLARAISSFALPLLAYACNPQWLRSRIHQLGLLMLGFGFAIFMTIHETGVRATDGNFIWQVIFANHIVFLCVALELLRQARQAKQGSKWLLLTGFYAVHCISGIVYTSVIIVKNNFY